MDEKNTNNEVKLPKTECGVEENTLAKIRDRLKFELFSLCLCDSIDKEYLLHPTRKNKVSNTFFDFYKLHSETFLIQEIGKYFAKELYERGANVDLFISRHNALPISTSLAMQWKMLCEKSLEIICYDCDFDWLKKINGYKSICIVDDLVSEGELTVLIEKALTKLGVKEIYYTTLIDCIGKSNPVELISILDHEDIKRTGVLVSISQQEADSHDSGWRKKLKKELPYRFSGSSIYY